MTDEPNVDKRAEHTHVGVIEFTYKITKPVGESQSQYLNSAEANYVFSTKTKKWVYQGCFPKGSGILNRRKGSS